METAWKVLLLAAVATLAVAQSLSHEEAVAAAISNYNRESDADNLFRLLELKPQERPLESPNAIPVNFTIQETVCPKVENRSPDQCDFKEGGVVRDCSGTVLATLEGPVVTVTCDKPIRTKRRWKLIKKGGKIVKDFLTKNNIIILPGGNE
ncbi:cathelicidin antimicrobial peptide-like [Tachyglossus aculeatus]|uniref:cathelicidin antimicrobial peptide-like n=1 Tax=Tachyglossus aculeatus TaxID=9261 RepID=UPI0018F4969F|nr:cathelicidin antimicrobial peptide-like [Tachyglossus aculeatus]